MDVMHKTKSPLICIKGNIKQHSLELAPANTHHLCDGILYRQTPEPQPSQHICLLPRMQQSQCFTVLCLLKIVQCYLVCVCVNLSAEPRENKTTGYYILASVTMTTNSAFQLFFLLNFRLSLTLDEAQWSKRLR